MVGYWSSDDEERIGEENARVYGFGDESKKDERRRTARFGAGGTLGLFLVPGERDNRLRRCCLFREPLREKEKSSSTSSRAWHQGSGIVFLALFDGCV